MFKLLLPATLVAGCTSGSPTARLADLPSPRVVGTNSSLSIDYDTSVDCFTLAPEVTAMIDGQAIALSSGGWSDSGAFNGKDCIGIGATFASLFDTNEPVTSIVVADGQSTWNLDIEGLAPSSWSIQTPASVTEGGGVTVAFTPALPGVSVDSITIAPDGGIPLTMAASGNSAQIPAGYWSQYDHAQSGSQLQGTIDVELGPLPQRCSGPQSCSFTTDTPNTANRVAISIP